MIRRLVPVFALLLAACPSGDPPAETAPSESAGVAPPEGTSAVPAADEAAEQAATETDEAPPGPVPETWEAVPEEHPLAAHAIEARGTMASRLQTRLMSTMASDGPVAAIEVCANEAPAIAEAVEEEFDVRVGRTAHRLRNPDNTTPEWAAALAEANVAEPGHWLREDGTLVGWAPIRVQAPCLSCHGQADQLAPGVAEMLATRYPDDAATGYAEGDLRGWFWVEASPNTLE